MDGSRPADRHDRHEVGLGSTDRPARTARLDVAPDRGGGPASHGDPAARRRRPRPRSPDHCDRCAVDQFGDVDAPPEPQDRDCGDGGRSRLLPGGRRDDRRGARRHRGQFAHGHGRSPRSDSCRERLRRQNRNRRRHVCHRRSHGARCACDTGDQRARSQDRLRPRRVRSAVARRRSERMRHPERHTRPRSRRGCALRQRAL